MQHAGRGRRAWERCRTTVRNSANCAATAAVAEDAYRNSAAEDVLVAVTVLLLPASTVVVAVLVL
jgi:hypothetical protein